MSRIDRIADTERFLTLRTGGGAIQVPAVKQGRFTRQRLHRALDRPQRNSKGFTSPHPPGLVRTAGNLPQNATVQAFAKP